MLDAFFPLVLILELELVQLLEQVFVDDPQVLFDQGDLRLLPVDVVDQRLEMVFGLNERVADAEVERDLLLPLGRLGLFVFIDQDVPHLLLHGCGEVLDLSVAVGGVFEEDVDVLLFVFVQLLHRLDHLADLVDLLDHVVLLFADVFVWVRGGYRGRWSSGWGTSRFASV